MADEAGVVADRQAVTAGQRAGERDALQGKPSAEFQGATDPDPVTAKPAKGGYTGKTRGSRFSGVVDAAIERAAKKHGVSAAGLRRTAHIESGGNPNARNPRSSAEGLFQFIDDTAKQYGLSKSQKFDPDASADAAARLWKDNANYLRRQLGREPTDGELYLAHQQGAGGAAKLLRNPNAKASSLVGAEAVRLNGGQPGMTAGDFARRWTGKMEGGYSIPNQPGPPTLSGGTWRPSGEDTIYARAYNEAGARTYTQTLENEIRSTTSQLFDRYRDDPAGLTKALGDLRGDISREHVFPEIQADFETGYDRIAESYLGQARENQRRNMEASERAEFIDNTGKMQTDLQRRVADFDPADDVAADGIASAQSALDAHYDDAVARGIITPDAAATAKASAKREAALTFYGKQADALDANGVKAMREKMKADFAAGGVDGLDGDGFATLDEALTRLETNKRREAAGAERDFRERGDGFAVRVANGLNVNPDDMARYALDADKTAQGKAALEETNAKISTARAIRDFSVTEGDAYVTGLRKQYGKDATESQLRRLAFAEAVLADKKKAIATDAVSYAETQELIPETPMLTDAGTAEDMASIMRSRVKTANDAAEQLGTRPRFLKAGEAKAIADAMRKDPAQGISAAASIIAGAGDRAGEVLAEFGDDAPMVAESGAIIAAGGSARAAQDVVLGYGKDANGKELTRLKPTEQTTNFKRVTGSALSLVPRDAQRIDRAAASIARKRISEEGVERDSDEALAIHEQAINEAAGAVFDRGVQYGGFVPYEGTTVAIPPAIRADRFEDLFWALTDEDLASVSARPRVGFGMGFNGRYEKTPLRTLADAKPVAVNGGFAFAVGEPGSEDPQFIQDENGGVFVLDLMALRDRLEPRVPGAFR
ncbi:transglycosylase SLT domain-containing protein [Tianweitania sp. BSSL-BM11]|uniref:Transglycosylase SLT domain-containing protein n=2 Tax=Tianweitania aestuarii TaxID=2814886 RepID=A0ABS5RSK5_9HYPH|nr:transglycosylase SLT domain-containing protein [Tianweitania aestuarii]